MNTLLTCFVVIMACLTTVSAEAHVFSQGISPSSQGVRGDGQDIILGIEEAGDRSLTFDEYIPSRSRHLVPFRWYPYVPKRRFRGGYYRPSQREYPRNRYSSPHLGEGRDFYTPHTENSHKHHHPSPGSRDSYRPSEQDNLRPSSFQAVHREKPEILFITAEGAEVDRRRPVPRQPVGPPVNLFVCPDRHSCSDAVWETRDTRGSDSWQDRGCMCDGACHEYGDCCRDAPDDDAEDEEDSAANVAQNAAASIDADASETISLGGLSTGSESKINEIPKDQRTGKHFRPPASGDEFACMKVPALDEENCDQSGVEYYIRTACPSSFDGFDNKVRCEHPISADKDPMSALLVTSGTTGVTYANYYCAMCHSDTSDLRFWQIGIVCRRFTDTTERLTQEDVADMLTKTSGGGWGLRLRSGDITPCSVTARPPAGLRPRSCKTSISQCPPSSPVSLSEACDNHTAIVYSGGRAYKNVYCLLCRDRSGAVECAPPCRPGERPAGAGGLRVRIQLRAGADDRCGEKQVRDPFTDKCRSVVCSRPGYILVGMECVEREEREKEAGASEDSEEGNSRDEADKLVISEMDELPESNRSTQGLAERLEGSTVSGAQPNGGNIPSATSESAPTPVEAEETNTTSQTTPEGIGSELDPDIDYDEFEAVDVNVNEDITSQLEAALRDELSATNQKSPTSERSVENAGSTQTDSISTEGKERPNAAMTLLEPNEKPSEIEEDGMIPVETGDKTKEKDESEEEGSGDNAPGQP